MRVIPGHAPVCRQYTPHRGGHQELLIPFLWVLKCALEYCTYALLCALGNGTFLTLGLRSLTVPRSGQTAVSGLLARPGKPARPLPSCANTNFGIYPQRDLYLSCVYPAFTLGSIQAFRSPRMG